MQQKNASQKTHLGLRKNDALTQSLRIQQPK
jgi:hypothetical protein